MSKLKGARNWVGRVGVAMAEQRNPTPVEQPITDRFEHYPELEAVRAAAEAGDWAQVVAEIDELPATDRAAAADEVTEVPGAEEMLERAVEADPDDLRAAALLGARVVTLAWEVRGGGYASSVTRDQFDVFHEHLRRAEGIFLDVLARDPGQPDALRWRLISCRGLSLGQGESRRRYDQAAARLPHDLGLQGAMLQQLCPKWGGTWEAAYSFVVQCGEAAPPGSPNAALLATYHIERWLAADAEETKGYFRRPHGVPLAGSVTQGPHAEIVRAAERSILHPDYVPRIGWVRMHGEFAMCLAMADDNERAAAQFEVLDSRMSESPWHYFDDPVKTYTTFRRLVQSRAAKGL